MDHLPRPLNPSLPAIQIPYVAREKIHPYHAHYSLFSGQFPQRLDFFHLFREWAGFSDQRIRDIGWSQCASTCPEGVQEISGTPKMIAESFLQEWLFFGLLFEILREDFQRSDFIDERPGLVVTTKLPTLLWKYKERMSLIARSDAEDAGSRGIRAITVLDEGSKFFNNYLGKYSSQRPDIALDKQVILSIGVILGTLCATVDECTQKLFGRSSTKFKLTWPAIVDDWLLQNHWCPNTLAMLERRGFGPQGMLYAAMLGPLNDRNRNHFNCHREDFECKANHVEESTYKVEHNPPCEEKKCHSIPINATRVCEIIEETEDYPILHVSAATDGSYGAVEAEVSAEQPYVAFSHVWMDGLGNPVENELPLCQIKRLCNLINLLPGKEQGAPVRLWIDTLCVPSRGKRGFQPSMERREAARSKAISRMADVYKDAEAVIILDSNIFASKQALCETSDTEVLMRLMSTNWMRRLWTLLEGVLAKKLYIAFPDGVVNIHQRVSSLQNLLDTSFDTLKLPREEELGQSVQLFPGEPISRTALRQFVDLRAVKEVGRDESLALMWNNMMWRSTSWAKDETICMAIILGFPKDNLSALLRCQVDWLRSESATPEAKSEQDRQIASRYKKFLLLLGELRFAIPRGLIFTRTDRFPSAKMGWAPKGFFRTAATGVQVEGRFKGEFVNNQGLYLSASGFELYLPPTELKSPFTLAEEPNTEPHGTFYRVDFNPASLKNPTGIPWTAITSKDIKDPALVVADDAVPLLRGEHAATGTVGVMLSITDRCEEVHQDRKVTVFHATYLARVFINKFHPQVLNWEVLAGVKQAQRANAVKEGLMRRLYDRRPGAEPQPMQPPLEHDPKRFDVEKNLWKEDAAALNYEFDCNWAVGRKITKDQVWCIADALQPEGS